MAPKYFTLSNGYKIPSIGFGTFRIPGGQATEQAVFDAIKNGYRHIDGAAAYRNEKSVGDAIKRSGVARSELFVTSKLWNPEKGYESTIAAFHKTLEDLGLDYLDLYLIHWPIAKLTKDSWQKANSDSWRAFEELYKQGKIKSIGVSNFHQRHFEPLFETAEIKPMVNQIEFHPGLLQKEVVAFSQNHGMLIEAWGPFANAQALNHARLREISEKYGKTTAQLCLRWILEKGILPLPKSVTEERMRANLEIFDFEISPEDAESIDGINDCVGSGLHPDTNIL